VVVHLWTLTGLAFALGAIKAAVAGDHDTAARLLVGVVLVDFTDGTLARRLRVRQRMPLISREIIDYIHDLVGLTLAPMLFAWTAGLFHAAYAFPLVVVATLAATLKYAMKPAVLGLGYSIGAPPIFASVLLCHFLDLGPTASTLYTAALVALVLLPVPFPITSLVTTHWKPGWQSVTTYLVVLAAPAVLIWLKDAPKALYWALFANVLAQLTVFPLLLRLRLITPGFRRSY
jgi:phosphatidylcholine synthase